MATDDSGLNWFPAQHASFSASRPVSFFTSHSHSTQPNVSLATPSERGDLSGRMDPSAWDGCEDTDPALVLNRRGVEHGDEPEAVPPEGWVA
jgi:hypothetical protein